MTLYEVQQILGHSDPKVTMRYAHLSTKALQEAANSPAVKIGGQVVVWCRWAWWLWLANANGLDQDNFCVCGGSVLR